MNRYLLPAIIIGLIATGAWFLHRDDESVFNSEDEGNEQEAGIKRSYYEWLISRDPATGKIPEGIHRRELEWSRAQASRTTGMMSSLVSNTYFPVGPTQNGGRTRALAFDVRNNGSSNRVVLAGGINSGIFRSEDGGLTWSFVNPTEEVRSVSCLAQDVRPGFQDTWYAGTGEAIGASAGQPNAFVFGFGVFKSTDNGKTWSKLAATVGTSSQFAFDNSFDIVSSIAVHPTTGDIYAAGHQSIIRSQDGGSSWAFVLRGSVPANNVQGVSDILIDKAGPKLYAAFSGRNPDRALSGVWTSASGDASSWARIAGGVQNAADSVPGWRAYDNTTSAGEFTGGWGRIVLGLSANQNQLYALVENAQSATSNLPEADLFRGDISGSTFTWSDLSANLVAKFNGTDNTYFQTQGGYDMEVLPHPTQNNIVYVGGVHLFRSTDGFTSSGNTLFMGGLKGGKVSSTISDPDQISHVDFHRLRCDPANPNRMIAASDGGLAITPDNTAVKPEWQNGNSQYQTIQYYHVGIDQQVGSRSYVGGAQDNSTTLRDLSAIFGPALPDTNDHYIIVGGDGGQAYLFRNPSGQPYMFASAQEGKIFRLALFGTPSLASIKPDNTGDGVFVTYYHLDEDNPNNLYFPSNDTLYRTTSSTTVTSGSGWTRLAGLNGISKGQIFSMATTRGNYTPNSMLLIGTSAGKIFRLKDPANADPNTVPDDITPSGMVSSDPNRPPLVKDIAVNPRNHDTVLAVVSNYGVNSIFWTGNATAPTPTWQVAEGNLTLPSVRSCKIVVSKNGVEYYVGTSVGLYSTTTVNSSGTFWTRENGGNGMMNTAVVNSIAYRWQDNTMVVGTHGNGMFAAYLGNAISLPTAVNTPIRDDKNFIVKAFPTITDNTLNFQAGNMLNIKSIQVQVVNLAGQILYNQASAYGSGSVNVSRLPAGTYILTITSNDRKYQFIRKFVKS